jgi:hypothetical protein
MKKLMTAMLALSFLGATAMIAQVPAATPDKAPTTGKKAPKKTTEKKAPTEKKDTTAKKAPKKAKKDTTN